MYRTKELNELKQIIEKASSLTYEAKVKLDSELVKRGMVDESLELKELIETDNDEIKNFKFLKNLGFKVETHNSSLIVTRTFMAILMDLIAISLAITSIIFGFLVISREVIALLKGEEFGIFYLLLGLALLYLGSQFFSGVRRFLDYLGFRLEINGCNVVMEKRVELKLERFQDKVQNIKINEDNGKIEMSLKGVEILDANQENIIQRLTITELYNRIKECC